MLGMHTSHGEVIAVILPLRKGTSAAVRELLADGPPFDAEQVGLDSHHVLVTEREAVFVFVAKEGVDAVEPLLCRPELWERAAAWRPFLADVPRIAEDAYSWTGSATAVWRPCVTSGFDF
jgi:hypothetical protein